MELQYDNSEPYPNDTSDLMKSELAKNAAAQLRRIGVVRGANKDTPYNGPKEIDGNLKFNDVTFDDDGEELDGPSLKGIYKSQGPGVSYIDLVSYWKAESVNFPCLTPLQNKILHYFHFEGLKYAEIAKRVRRDNIAVKSQLQRARAKLRSKYSKGGKGKFLDIIKTRKDFPKNEKN